MFEESPRHVDRYEILSSIGEGGMAVVYHARFEATGGASKQVALKLIHPHLSQEPELVRMFIDEMRVAMAMSHRNIVQTFDAGKYGDRYYLVMELMNRGSLSGVSSMPLDIAVLVAMEVCAALDYAHTFRDEPVVHRDVSPSNILLSDQGDVKLADFGVARVTGRLSPTITGTVKGKLRYMAPEQARGEIDLRSDLFSLGAVLYWMVTGWPLRPNPSLELVRDGVDRVEFPAGGAAEIPLSLQALISRCLRPEPEQRPASAAELRELLARELGVIQLKMGTDGDPLARLRGFFAPRAPTVAQPKDLARRLAHAVLQVALAVPTNPGQQVSLEEASTTADPALDATTGASPVPLGMAGTAETTVSPIRQRQRLRLTWLASALLASTLLGSALAVGTWALWPRTPARIAARAGDASIVHPDAARAGDVSVVHPDAARAGDVSVVHPDARPAPQLPDASAPEPDAAPSRKASVDRPRVPRGQGLLDLNSSPWAKVYIDGRLAGETPLQGIRLRAGHHAVRLVNDERKLSARLTIHVRAGHTTRRWIRLGAPLSP